MFYRFRQKKQMKSIFKTLSIVSTLVFMLPVMAFAHNHVLPSEKPMNSLKYRKHFSSFSERFATSKEERKITRSKRMQKDRSSEINLAEVAKYEDVRSIPNVQPLSFQPLAKKGDSLDLIPGESECPKKKAACKSNKSKNPILRFFGDSTSSKSCQKSGCKSKDCGSCKSKKASCGKCTATSKCAKCQVKSACGKCSTTAKCGKCKTKCGKCAEGKCSKCKTTASSGSKEANPIAAKVQSNKSSSSRRSKNNDKVKDMKSSILHFFGGKK